MQINFVSLIGWLILLFALLFLLNLIYKMLWTLHEIFYPFIIGRPRNLKRLAGADWAVVTGATDGIGKAYAFELAAKHQFNLVLISRSQQKLDATADELHEKHPTIQIQTIAFDFTNTKVEDYERVIFSLLDNLPIGLLVNNVGVTYDYPEKLHKVRGGLKKLHDVLVVNSLPMTLLTARILDQMCQRNKGIIVNISSAAAFHPLAYWGVYSAIKEYMCWLDMVLRREYSSTRIHIQTVCPMLVITKMSAAAGDYPKALAVTPETFARQAVRSIGLINKTTGCLSHQIQYSLGYKILPNFIKNLMVEHNSRKTKDQVIAKLQSEEAGTSGQNAGVEIPLITTEQP